MRPWHVRVRVEGKDDHGPQMEHAGAVSTAPAGAFPHSMYSMTPSLADEFRDRTRTLQMLGTGQPARLRAHLLPDLVGCLEYWVQLLALPLLLAPPTPLLDVDEDVTRPVTLLECSQQVVHAAATDRRRLVRRRRRGEKLLFHLPGSRLGGPEASGQRGLHAISIPHLTHGLTFSAVIFSRALRRRVTSRRRSSLGPPKEGDGGWMTISRLFILASCSFSSSISRLLVDNSFSACKRALSAFCVSSASSLPPSRPARPRCLPLKRLVHTLQPHNL